MANFPRFIDDHALPVGEDVYAVRKTVVGANSNYQIYYSGVFFYVIIWAIPFISLTFLTQRLIVSLKQFHARREVMSSAGKADNDLTVTLVVVVVIFMICQVLNPIRRLLVGIMPNDRASCGPIHWVYTPITVMGVIVDSSIHFLIYSLCDSRFRVRLRRRLTVVQRFKVSTVHPSGPSGGASKLGSTPARATSSALGTKRGDTLTELAEIKTVPVLK